MLIGVLVHSCHFCFREIALHFFRTGISDSKPHRASRAAIIVHCNKFNLAQALKTKQCTATIALSFVNIP